ncbi:FtsK/SpoIIIE domain-containing protein [Streptomyces sp. NPDC001380]|uniref:FtsK/SpoIIIE domain-containing protein n=1 Tax=Streptomyces sp. NPDC001380 TaxID=3364566 RepID=UPI003695B760
MSESVYRPDSGTADGADVIDLTALLPAAPQPSEDLEAELRPLPEDLDGDRPFVPSWARSPEGRKAARVRAQRRTRRAVRRWASRQRTERGHLAQVARGVRRSAEWVGGIEGAHLAAARHQAHTATREARHAARKARYTLVPAQRRAAQQHADRAQTAAAAAVAAHTRAKAEVRRGRLLRGSLVWGLPGLADGMAFLEGGWPGLAGGVLATLGGFALAGRRPLTAETWDPERRSLADGDPLTPDMLTEALRAAKVIGEADLPRYLTPAIADGPDAWTVLIDLPAGVTVDKVRGRALELAAALGIDQVQLDLRQAGGAGRLQLWASMTDPFGRTVRSPLLDRREPLNTWKAGIPLAFDARGQIVAVTISDYSLLFGGATRSGKGMGLANVLSGVSLDPRVRVRLFDGKGTGEYVPYAPMLATYVRRDPARLVEFLRVVIREMNRRTDLLVDLGLSKLSEELIEKVGGIELVIVDELATYTAKEGPSKEYAEEVAELLAQIAAVGAAVGIVLALATQYPEVGIVPARLRGNCSGRMAMRTESADASNVILGKGAAGLGYDSSKIPNEKGSRGRAWLTTPDTGMIHVRSLYIDETSGEVGTLIAAGIELRRAAGTLPGHCPDPIEDALLAGTGLSSVAGGPDGRGTAGVPAVRHPMADLLRRAFADLGAAELGTADLVAWLHRQDPAAGWDPRDGESDKAFATRTGRRLGEEIAAALEGTGRALERVRVTTLAGVDGRGYRLADVEAAFGV